MDDFFIGWEAASPSTYRRKSRQFVMALAILVPILAVLIVVAQRNFSTSIFEYGKFTSLSGVYRSAPVPMLEIQTKPGTTITILLVGTGKHGAEAQIRKMESRIGPEFRLDGKTVILQGFLIYHDGKGLLELDGENPLIQVQNTEQTAVPADTLGPVTLCGEIADPKCYFGVMKPGYGKPHRSCAVRCISGGIPPVFKVENEKNSQYYLLKGKNGEDISTQLLEYVADGVRISGQLMRHGDWFILQIDPSKDIVRERPYWFGKHEVLCGSSATSGK